MKVAVILCIASALFAVTQSLSACGKACGTNWKKEGYVTLIKHFIQAGDLKDVDPNTLEDATFGQLFDYGIEACKNILKNRPASEEWAKANLEHYEKQKRLYLQTLS